MYSISELAKQTQVTARTLRYYEEKGLISSSRYNDNGYRYYDSSTIELVLEIKKFKKMEFSLEEIRSLLSLREEGLVSSLVNQLEEKLIILDKEIERLGESKKGLVEQLVTTQKFLNGENLNRGQRRILMETSKSEILNELKSKREVTQSDLEYLKREDYLFDSKEKRDFFIAVGKCLKFAKSEGIKLGPARGAAPASLSLYALGWGDFDPMKYDLIPERYHNNLLDLHIDVEFENGKRFVNYCHKISADLKVGRIEAFKLPILDIIENVQERLETRIDFDLIDDNDPLVLKPFQNGDIDKVFSVDIPKNYTCCQVFR